jgi:peptidoglycan/xylan/chitin deacetylase (PgdA/CDA1 family)
MAKIDTTVPIVSFTFDDAPKTAFGKGREILGQHGIRATFFMSFGLLGTQTEVGAIATPDDLTRAIEEGSELGCHTFDHLDPWESSTEVFIDSVARNKSALDKIVPGATFDSFAYPKSGAKLALKLRLRESFRFCRGGGQVCNTGAVDLNLVKACFLDRRTGVDMHFIKELVQYNAAQGGWLVFATHDVTDHPSPYGCTPAFLSQVAECVASSGALLLPFGEAGRRLHSTR